MPAFGKMLKADELAQVITYTRNALGNSVGDEIQPKAVQAMLPEGAAAVSESDEDEEEVEESAPAAETKADKNAPLSKEALMAKGKTVYESHCVSCHQAGGQGLPPTFPALTGSDVVNGDIKEQIKLMKAGKGMMPAFGGTLSPEEFAAVVTYTRNALGNSVNDLITPEEIEPLLK
jgi:cytochrome c oxidase subunit 2